MPHSLAVPFKHFRMLQSIKFFIDCLVQRSILIKYHGISHSILSMSLVIATLNSIRAFQVFSAFKVSLVHGNEPPSDLYVIFRALRKLGDLSLYSLNFLSTFLVASSPFKSFIVSVSTFDINAVTSLLSSITSSSNPSP